MRNMYHAQGFTDLDKMKDQAKKISAGDYYAAKEEVIIHEHGYMQSCEDKTHHQYKEGVKQEEADQ